VRDLIREICRSQDIEILQGHIRPDHVHLLLSVPPRTWRRVGSCRRSRAKRPIIF
jgi:REP element-mobilizing transposase RayT